MRPQKLRLAYSGSHHPKLCSAFMAQYSNNASRTLAMCDYSLMNVPNRLAQDGEELATHRFLTGSLGLVSQLDLLSDTPPPTCLLVTFLSMLKDFFALPEAKPMPAVCVPPGARLALLDIPRRLQREHRIGAAEEVTFTQLTLAASAYRDAVRFSNGREILLQQLDVGQRVRVLALDQIDVSNSAMSEELVLPSTSREIRHAAFVSGLWL